LKVQIEISAFVEKQIKKLPRNIVESLYVWIEQVNYLGLREVRKIKGYHDEPLKGERKGQRSVRLNKSYRAIYKEGIRGMLHIVTVIDVNKHEY
jgi:toxin HigB-1